MERERRRREAAGENVAAQDSGQIDAQMHQEEEKKEEEPFHEQPDSNMKGDDAEDGEDGGWDDEDGDGDGEGWDEWDDDEDEVDPVVAAALAQAARKRELEEKISEVTIKFRPHGYRQGMVARIVGDFTDWVPFTM